MDDRSAKINIGGREFELILTTRATKEIAGRYGGLENLGEKLMRSENFEMALDELVWLITLLANQSVLIHNLRSPEDKQELLTQETVELLTSPLELAEYKSAIMEAMFKGSTGRRHTILYHSQGYHSGAGKVSVSVETKSVTPTKAVQDIVPSVGKLLSKVTVAAIPDEFVDTSDADAAATNILDGKTAFVNGEKITGSMPNNGSTSATMDGLTTMSVVIPAGYTSGGTVSLTSDIEEALAAI